MTLLYFCIAATGVFLAPTRAQSWALANTGMVIPEDHVRTRGSCRRHRGHVQGQCQEKPEDRGFQ